MNDTLMQQCRREAEERYPMPVFESGNYVHTTDVALAHAVVSARQESHAAALYAERSKPQPSVDALMSCIDNYFGDSRFEVPWDILDRGELRDRLAKLFTHRP